MPAVNTPPSPSTSSTDSSGGDMKLSLPPLTAPPPPPLLPLPSRLTAPTTSLLLRATGAEMSVDIAHVRNAVWKRTACDAPSAAT
jgi:hypothetical protein